MSTAPSGLPRWLSGREAAYNGGDVGFIPGSGRSPGGGHGNLLQYSCLENSHGQRSLVGHSPWGHKESDTTEQLSTAPLLLLATLLALHAQWQKGMEASCSVGCGCPVYVA